jgi:hypothetical protein
MCFIQQRHFLYTEGLNGCLKKDERLDGEPIRARVCRRLCRRQRLVSAAAPIQSNPIPDRRNTRKHLGLFKGVRSAAFFSNLHINQRSKPTYLHHSQCSLCVPNNSPLVVDPSADPLTCRPPRPPSPRPTAAATPAAAALGTFLYTPTPTPPTDLSSTPAASASPASASAKCIARIGDVHIMNIRPPLYCIVMTFEEEFGTV